MQIWKTVQGNTFVGFCCIQQWDSVLSFFWLVPVLCSFFLPLRQSFSFMVPYRKESCLKKVKLLRINFTCQYWHLMHSLIQAWFLSPSQLPNSQCGAYSQQRCKHQYCCTMDCILQILFSSYPISLSFNQSLVVKN